MSTTTTSNEPTPDPRPFSCIYFGFASNLSPRTMRQRCPSATYAGLALLKGWKFVISETGFGNIIPSAADHVYGSLHFLNGRDEEALDKSEEVPRWHQKRKLTVTRLINGQAGQEVEVTVYVDVERMGEGVVSKEYIVWVRKAMEDGLVIGVPGLYFETYWERFLPEDRGVGREEKIMMIRTVQMDKENTGYVPSHILRSVDKGS